MTVNPETPVSDNRNPSTQIAADRDARAYLARIAGEGWSVPTLVGMIRDRYPAVRLTAGNIDATCHALGIVRVPAKRGGNKVPNPHTRHPAEPGLRRAKIHKGSRSGGWS